MRRPCRISAIGLGDKVDGTQFAPDKGAWQKYDVLMNHFNCKAIYQNSLSETSKNLLTFYCPFDEILDSVFLAVSPIAAQASVAKTRMSEKSTDKTANPNPVAAFSRANRTTGASIPISKPNMLPIGIEIPMIPAHSQARLGFKKPSIPDNNRTTKNVMTISFWTKLYAPANKPNANAAIKIGCL